MDEFTITYNALKSPLENLLEHSNYEDEFSLNNASNIWRQNLHWEHTWSNSGQITLSHDAKPYYYKVLQILKENLFMIGESQHKRNMMELLYRLCKSGKDQIEGITKDWLDQLYKLKIEQYTFVGFIADYPFTNSFKINGVTISPIDSKEGKKIIKNTCPEIQKYNFVNQGLNAVFSCKVEAYDEEDCKLTAIFTVNYVLSLIKVIDMQSEVRLQAKNYPLPKELYFCETKNTQEIMVHNKSRQEYTTKSCKSKEIENLRKCAGRFLLDDYKNDLEFGIMSALYWYGHIDTSIDDEKSQYISYMNGLERLVLYDSPRDKAIKFAERLSKRFKQDKDEMENFYKTRNELLHEDEPDIYEEELLILRNMLADLIQDLICQSEKHATFYSYFKQYHIR